MTSRKNISRKTLLALGLVLGVLALSLAGWRASAHELGWRWLAQPASSVPAQPQAKRAGQSAAAAVWEKLRGLNLLGSGKPAGALFTDYTFSGSGNWTDAARWSPSYPGLTIASGDAVIIASGAVCTIPNFTTVTINGALTVSGTLNKDTANAALSSGATGSISIPAGGALNNNSGAITNAGALTTDAGSTFTNGSGAFTNSGTFNNATTFHTQYGSFSNSGTVTNTGTLTGSQYASISNTGSWTNGAGGSLTMNGLSNGAAGTITNNGTLSAGLTNSGTVINNATVNGNYFGITNNNGATWTNSPGSTMPIGLQPWTNSGTWNQNGSFSMTEGSGLSSINNTATGVLNIGGSFTLNGGVPGTNNGTINVNSGGSLALNGSHATFTNNGTLANSGAVTNASVFKGTGSQTGNVFTNSSGGTVAPGASPGCHSFSDYTNAGTLAIEIGGATTCTQHDQLQASGTAMLGGTLTISMFGVYTPGTTTSYTILTAATVSGTFATINYPTVCGISWSIAYNATNVVVTATVAAQPEINVQGNGVSIADGDPSPSASDHTDFGSVGVTSGTIQRTFTIQNTGLAALTVSSITKSGAQQADFTIGALMPANPIPAGGSATFTVTFDPSATGLRTATINIANSDCDEAAYDFAIQGTGANSAPIANSQSKTTNLNTAVSLTLTGSDADAGTTLTYMVTQNPANGVLTGAAPNVTYTPNTNYSGADSFKFKVRDGAVDSAEATVSLTVLNTPDASAGLKAGLVAYYPFETSANDTSGRGNHGVGGTQGNAGGKFGSYSTAGVSLCTPTDLTFGTNSWSVALWFRKVPNSAGIFIGNSSTIAGGPNTSWTISDTANLNAPAVLVSSNAATNQRLSLNGGIDFFTPQWDLKVLTVDQTTNTATLWSGIGSSSLSSTSGTFTDGHFDSGRAITLSLFEYDDLAFWNRALTSTEVQELWNNGTGVRLGAQTLAQIAYPDVAVYNGATTAAPELTDGQATNVDFGLAAATRSFTIKNNGPALLVQNGVTFTGANPTDFSVAGLPSGCLEPGESATFTVTWTPGAAGIRTATLRLASNDPDENPFDFPVRGGVALNTAPTITRSNASVSVNEGSVAANSGTFSDAQGNSTVTLSASLGTVTKDDALGTWSWTYPTPDGPDGPTTVTITANDGVNPAVMATFTLTVNNVAPKLNSCGPPSFNLVTTGIAGWFTAAADFDNDGDQDIVTTSPNGGVGPIFYRNNGNGNFTQVLNFGEGHGYPLTVGDVNGDGNQDAILFGKGKVLLGNGAFGFTTGATFTSSLDNGVYEDVSGDGVKDIVVGAFFDGKVAVHLGTGTGGFGPAAIHTVLAGSRIYVAVADFTGDGKRDIAAARQNDGQVTLLINNGSGGFSVGSSFAVGTSPRALAAGDFNNDGKQDLAVPSFDSSNVSILLGTGAGGFSAAPNVSVGVGPHFILVTDFNNDGNQDLAVARSIAGPDQATVLAGNGDGSFGLPASFGTQQQLLNIFLADMNNDGALDIVLGQESLVEFVQANVAPTTVTVNEGATAMNSGTFCDSGVDMVMISASIGTVTQNNGAGTWSWSYPTNDGPAQNAPVTITATDSDGATATYTFNLVITNLNPTATLASGGAINEGSNGTVSFSNPADASAPDASAVFHYAYDFDNDGTFESGDGTYSGSGTSATATIPASFLAEGPGSHVVKGRILDKDGGFTDYTTSITINNVAPLFEAGANETLPTTVGAFNRGPVSFTDPGADSWTGTVNYGDGTGNQALTINQLAKSFSLSHTYTTSNTFLVKVTVNDDDGGSYTGSFTVTVNLNTPPTIAAAATTRQQGSSSANTQIATVGDANQAANTLTVTLNGNPAATVNGVGVSNLTIAANGALNADVVADCNATDASFTLTVTDNAGATTPATLTVSVTANSAPVLSYSPQTVGAAGSLVVNPLTGPSDNGSIVSLSVLSVTPVLLTAPTIASDGKVTITNAGPAGSHTITLLATDNCRLTTEVSFTLNVTCPTLTLGPATIPGGTVGQPYLPTSFTATGGNGTLTYSLSGTLPTGMTFVNGQLADTPTEAGNFPITVTATDAYGCSVSKSYTLVVSCPTILISPSSLPIAQINAAYPAQPFTASGGNAPYTLSLSGTLPTGMSFTGDQLAGTPTLHGDFPFTINVTDKYGCTASRSYTLKVNRPPVAACKNVILKADANGTVTADINNGSSDPDGDPLSFTQAPAGPYTVGKHTVTLTVQDDREGTSTCTGTVTVSWYLAQEFVALGTESIKLDNHTKVHTGNIGANTSLPNKKNGKDDQEEVELGERVQMLQAGSDVVGDTVRLRSHTQVYNVHFNERIFGSHVTILGTQVTPQGLPVVAVLPTLPAILPGTQDIEVGSNQTRTLAPGSYRNIKVKNKGKLIFTGGLYQIANLEAGEEASLLFKAAAEVRIKEELEVKAKSYVGPDAAAPALEASQIIFYVEGKDAKDDDDDDDDDDDNDDDNAADFSSSQLEKFVEDDDDDDDSRKVAQIGDRCTIKANIYAPNGTLWLKSNTKATGAFIGKVLRIGQGVELWLKSAFSF